MQQTFMLGTDSLSSSISEVWVSMIDTSMYWLENTKEGVQLAIKSKASGSGNVRCHIFILSDAQLNSINRELESVTY